MVADAGGLLPQGHSVPNPPRVVSYLVCLFVLIDSRHTPQAKDLEFIDQLGEWQIPFKIVFTKTDKNKPAVTPRNIDAFMKKLSPTWTELPGYFISSALMKTGRKEILEFIDRLNKEIKIPDNK